MLLERVVFVLKGKNYVKCFRIRKTLTEDIRKHTDTA